MTRFICFIFIYPTDCFNFLSERNCIAFNFTFDVNKKKNIQYKIGVSYVSVENARENLKAENTGWDFLPRFLPAQRAVHPGISGVCRDRERSGHPDSAPLPGYPEEDLPVSYTHLDVYKRQRQHNRGDVTCRAHTFFLVCFPVLLKS